MATCSLTEVLMRGSQAIAPSVPEPAQRSPPGPGPLQCCVQRHSASGRLPQFKEAPAARRHRAHPAGCAAQILVGTWTLDSANAAHLAALPGGAEVLVSGESWKRAPVTAAGRKAPADAMSVTMEKKLPSKLPVPRRLKVGTQVRLTRTGRSYRTRYRAWRQVRHVVYLVPGYVLGILE
jgi:hypothetical protein